MFTLPEFLLLCFIIYPSRHIESDINIWRIRNNMAAKPFQTYFFWWLSYFFRSVTYKPTDFNIFWDLLKTLSDGLL